MRKSWKIVLAVVLSLGLLTFTALPASAEKYPSKPIKIIVPLGAGGSHDLHSRAVASVLHQYIGQPAYVQLMPGGGGKIGMGALKRASRTAHLLMAKQASLHVAQWRTWFRPFKDFIPCSRSTNSHFSPRWSSWKNFKAYIPRRKTRQDQARSTGAYGLSHHDAKIVRTKRSAHVPPRRRPA